MGDSIRILAVKSDGEVTCASLAKFHHRFPVCCKIQTASGDRIIEAFLQGEADIGITFNASARAEMTSTADEVAIACGSSIAAQSIKTQRRIKYAHRSHRSGGIAASARSL